MSFVHDTYGNEYRVTITSSWSTYWPWGISGPAVGISERRGKRDRAWLLVRSRRIRVPIWLCQSVGQGIDGCGIMCGNANAPALRQQPGARQPKRGSDAQ